MIHDLVHGSTLSIIQGWKGEEIDLLCVGAFLFKYVVLVDIRLSAINTSEPYCPFIYLLFTNDKECARKHF